MPLSWPRRRGSDTSMGELGSVSGLAGEHTVRVSGVVGDTLQ